MCKIIINPIGGLANRMRSLAGGLSLAMDLGVDYQIIWQKNWEINAEFCDIFEKCALISDKIEYPGLIKYALAYLSPRKRNAFISALTLRRFGLYLFDEHPPMSTLSKETDSNLRIKEMVERCLSEGKDCFISSGLNFADYTDDFYRSLFRPAGHILDQVQLIEKSMGEKRIGIHIRRTDNSVSILHSPDSLFIQEIDRIISNDSSLKFYLATDDEKTKERFCRAFPGYIFTSPRAACRSTKSGITDAMVEMVLLSRTKLVLGSYYSSFSEAAALLGDIPLRKLKIHTTSATD